MNEHLNVQYNILNINQKNLLESDLISYTNKQTTNKTKRRGIWQAIMSTSLDLYIYTNYEYRQRPSEASTTKY